jgi:hypothetical protein
VNREETRCLGNAWAGGVSLLLPCYQERRVPTRRHPSLAISVRSAWMRQRHICSLLLGVGRWGSVRHAQRLPPRRNADRADTRTGESP